MRKSYNHHRPAVLKGNVFADAVPAAGNAGAADAAPRGPQFLKSFEPVSRAFSLVEVLAVVVVLGILAAVVVPRFGGVTDEARTAALDSSVNGVRASIASFRTRAVIAGDSPFPTLAELTTPGEVLADGLPENPFNGLSSVQAVSRADAEARVVINESGYGWCYFVDQDSDPAVAIFYANTAAATTKADSSNNSIGANLR